MPQFKAQVPYPLRKDLPKRLTAGGVRAPPVEILFLVFIREHGLKTAAVQVKI
jgi:hypothetical protein